MYFSVLAYGKLSLFKGTKEQSKNLGVQLFPRPLLRCISLQTLFSLEVEMYPNNAIVSKSIKIKFNLH